MAGTSQEASEEGKGRDELVKDGRETRLQEMRRVSRRDAGEINEGHRGDQTASREEKQPSTQSKTGSAQTYSDTEGGGGQAILSEHPGIM